MNWDAIGAIGEMIGALAVIVTLAYLAVQVSHAQRELKRSVVVGRYEGVRELLVGRANNALWCSAYEKASAALGGRQIPFISTVVERCGLTRDEAFVLFFDQAAFFQLRVQSIAYADQLSASQKLELDGNLRREYGGATPVSQLWYQTTKSALNIPDAVRYIDNVLAQPG